jgi:hypothetical protein
MPSIDESKRVAKPPHFVDQLKEARVGRYQIDAWGALCRNAEAAELEAQRQRFTNRRTYRGDRRAA